MNIEPKVEIQNLLLQEESSDRGEISVELRFDQTPEIMILKDGSYEHTVEVIVDRSTGKVLLRERPLDYPFTYDPERPGDRESYRNTILLFNSSWDEGPAAEVPEPYIDVLISNGPSAEGDFVEVEDASGRSIKAGEWIDKGNGLWALRLRPRDIRRDDDAGQETVRPQP